MDSKLPDAVDAPTAWVMRKAMFAALMNRRADAVTAADGKGPFLFRGPAQTPDGPAGRAVRHPGRALGAGVERRARRARART